MPASPIPSSLPTMLRPAWRASDPATRCDRLCDALGEATPHQKLSTREGDYWICSRTGQMTRDQFPVHSAELYDQWWTQEMLTEKPASAEIQRRRRWLERIAPFRPGGRLLEVGSGQGLLCRAALEIGWSVEGNEISPVAAEALRQATGIVVHTGPIEGVALADNDFDLIICDNVFEHLVQPMAVLRKLTAALRPEGVIYLHTVCAQSLSVWFQPKDWSYYNTGHTFLPTLVSMNHYLAACGLERVFLRTHGFRSLGQNHRERSRPLRRRLDKLVATVVSRVGCGHRIEAILKRSGRR